jgi:hypothetical protein
MSRLWTTAPRRLTFVNGRSSAGTARAGSHHHVHRHRQQRSHTSRERATAGGAEKLSHDTRAARRASQGGPRAARRSTLALLAVRRAGLGIRPAAHGGHRHTCRPGARPRRYGNPQGPRICHGIPVRGGRPLGSFHRADNLRGTSGPGEAGKRTATVASLGAGPCGKPRWSGNDCRFHSTSVPGTRGVSGIGVRRSRPAGSWA